MAKELLKWIVTYNSSFSNNHKTLFNEVQNLAEQGKLDLIKQCDFVKNRQNVVKLLNNAYIDEILTAKTNGNRVNLSESELIDQICKNPKKTLKSVISLWYYEPWNQFTRIDAGEVELKYRLDNERRNPKWN